MAWEFKRALPAPDGGTFATDGAYAENFMAGVHFGVTQARQIKGWTETIFGMSEGFVYFMGIGEPYITHVKIGFTAGDPRSRLAALQTGCPFKIALLGFIFGTVSQEAELHRLLKDDRANGEWFAFSDYVEATVRSLLEGAETA